MQNNKEIRKAIESSGIKYHEVARKLRISDTHFSRMLRWEVEEEFKIKILEAVQELKIEKWGEEGGSSEI